MTDDRVIPIRRVMELLRDGAEERGLNAIVAGDGVSIMCACCYPDQPERLQFSARRVRPVQNGEHEGHWYVVLHEECDGLVSIRYPYQPSGHNRLIPVADAVASLEPGWCCHDDDNALGGWYWRSDLEAAIERELESAGDAWTEEWDRLVREREASSARQAAITDAYVVGKALNPKERVQAVASVLKAAGKPVTVEQARVWWECGHVGEGGDFERITVVVTSDGLPARLDGSCVLNHGDDDHPEMVALAAEYARVAALPPEERSAYKPVPEAARGRGAPWGRRSGAPKAKAEPKPQWTPPMTRQWFMDHGILTTLGVQELFAKAKACGAPHPPRAAIEEMKRAYRPE